MPVAVAIGRGPKRWVEEAGGPSVALRDTAIIGYRDKEESRAHGMLQPEELGPELTHLDIDHVRAAGPGSVGAQVAASLATEGQFWLHFDVDVLDQDAFAATDYLMPNGMNWEELAAAMAPIASSPSLIGASIACYNPEKDPGFACGRELVGALRQAFGAPA
jgi:arginase